jgi:protein-disulfide isomerase
MKAFIGGGAITLALLLAGCGKDEANNATATNASVNAAPLTQVEAPNGDWTQVVTETPEFGFRMGNPNAPVKLVEYASMTCPHCAEFSQEAGEKLKNEYVKSGQVSWEFRPYLLFATDAGISQLVRCQGPAPAFRLIEQIYADQKNWSAKFQNLPPEDAQRIQALPPAQQVGALVKAGGMDQFFRQRGMPEAKINACLSDQAGLQRLVGITQKANADMPSFPGTPTFLINGEMVPDTASWKLLEPKLREAIG